MSFLREVMQILEDDTSESPNTPNPLRIDPWGENRVLGIVIPNMPRFTKSGLEIPVAQQNIPSAMQIVKVSERVTDEYPKLLRMKQQHDPDGEGILFDGPVVAFAQSGGGTWTYSAGTGEQFDFAVVHAKSIRGDYTPYYEGKEYDPAGSEEKADA